ncbi:MAG TPA: ABC transporter ATP-binding protein [Stellaceae bacterium]|jgi:branched-chain amino acid transport system ATP-binding protein|nr:ABC transporter ATP-binding protein [Stellaceae bacterium]
MAEAVPLLEIDGLSLGYTDEPVVRNFSTVIPAGSITTIIGPNGAGKSTLLGGLYGLARHFAGRVRFDGAEIQGLAPPERLKRGIGLVPQGRCNFPLMSVRENLDLGTYTLPRAGAAAAVERMLDLFPLLRTRWGVRAGDLSGGEQQILETAMVLAAGPRLLLLDEPSLGLSPGNQRQVLRTIRDIRAGGVTVLMVEQNAAAALRVSDTAIVLELGRKVLEGSARRVLDDPAVQVAYLGGTGDVA